VVDFFFSFTGFDTAAAGSVATDNTDETIITESKAQRSFFIFSRPCLYDNTMIYKTGTYVNKRPNKKFKKI
jgi:hypothetical protein